MKHEAENAGEGERIKKLVRVHFAITEWYWFLTGKEKIREESRLSYYNDKPTIKMLLRDVQLVLRSLIVFREAFPETSSFEDVMKEEFNERADVYVERESE